MGNNGRSTNSQNPLDIPDTRAIMSQLNNILMNSWLVGIIEIVKLEAFTTKPAQESLDT